MGIEGFASMSAINLRSSSVSSVVLRTDSRPRHPLGDAPAFPLYGVLISTKMSCRAALDPSTYVRLPFSEAAKGGDRLLTMFDVSGFQFRAGCECLDVNHDEACFTGDFKYLPERLSVRLISSGGDRDGFQIGKHPIVNRGRVFSDAGTTLATAGGLRSTHPIPHRHSTA